MDCALRITLSSTCSLPKISQFNYYCHTNPIFIAKKLYRIHTSDAVSRSYSSYSARFTPFHSYFTMRFGNCTKFKWPTGDKLQAIACGAGDIHRRSNLQSLFCYYKPIPEEIIEKPIGLSLIEINVGNNPHCPSCQAKGAVLCTTCSGSGLYVDSILESQGIIVKVRCLGCGGIGNTMCSKCGGRGHTGQA